MALATNANQAINKATNLAARVGSVTLTVDANGGWTCSGAQGNFSNPWDAVNAAVAQAQAEKAAAIAQAQALLDAANAAASNVTTL